MSRNHLEIRIESFEADYFFDRHFGCDVYTSFVLVTQMLLLSYLWKKSIKQVNVLKETVHLNCSKIECPKMWESKTRVTSSNPRVASSNPRVTCTNPQVTSSNPRVMSSNSRVTSSNPRVMSSNLRVRRLKARVRRLKARLEAIKPRVE